MDWREKADLSIKKMPEHIKALRENCLSDLRVFARTMNPGYMYGEIHMTLFEWMMGYNLFGSGDGLTANKLIMLPRAHLKSHMVATWSAWIITRHPEVTMLYLSATAELAETQLFAIKNILESSRFQKLFPEYINPQEMKREMWNSRKISVDHIKRLQEGVRDPTVATAGLTTNTTGWHADIIVPDDIVVPENAYTEEGRDSVMKKASQFTSIRNAGGFTMACGTRYHPADIYDTWRSQVYDIYDLETGELDDTIPVWDIQEHQVENDGVFLWPRAIRDDGKAYGFDRNILARIRAEYSDLVQFFAQYYNDPNTVDSNRIDRSKFQYYDQKFLKYREGRWFFNNKPLNIYAAIDFAFSKKKRSDYTALVIIGMCAEGHIYVLDIIRFRTDKINDVYAEIVNAHVKWNFNKLRAEVTVAQAMIVEDIKDRIRKEGLSLAVDDYRPTRNEGAKAERIAAVLEPRYSNLSIWHYKGGYIPALEEEVILARPKHDDIKDALASVIEIAKPPRRLRDLDSETSNVIFHSKFGGVSFGGRI
jgi:phage terminase large subunit-like protein